MHRFNLDHGERGTRPIKGIIMDSLKKFGYSKRATSMNLALEAGDQFEVYPTAQEARAVADKRARETARAPLGFGGRGSAA